MRGVAVRVTGLLALATPALAEPGDANLRGLLFLYLLYGIVSFCLAGWSFLVLLMARGKVELTARTLSQRPLASFVMGMLCFGWLLLSLALAKTLGGLGGLLVLITLSVLTLCALLGFPAILIGLGRRASEALHLSSWPAREVGLGALVLFSAGGFPWLGQLLLAGLTVWACGGSVLGLLAGGPAHSEVTERES